MKPTQFGDAFISSMNSLGGSIRAHVRPVEYVRANSITCWSDLLGANSRLEKQEDNVMLSVSLRIDGSISTDVEKHLQRYAFVRDGGISIPSVLKNDWEEVIRQIADQNLTLLSPPRFFGEWNPRSTIKSSTAYVLDASECVRLANQDADIDPNGSRSHHDRRVLNDRPIVTVEPPENDIMSVEGELICSKRLLRWLDYDEQSLVTERVMHGEKLTSWVRLLPGEQECKIVGERSLNSPTNCFACGEPTVNWSGIWLATDDQPFAESTMFDSIRHGHRSSVQPLIVSIDQAIDLYDNIKSRNLDLSPVFSPNSREADFLERFGELIEIAFNKVQQSSDDS